MPQLWANNAVSVMTTLNLGVGVTGANVLQIGAGHGARFPAITAPDYCLLTIDDGTNVEIVKVTGRSTDQFTIPTGGRGQEGTTDRSWTAGASVKVELRITKGFLDRIEGVIDELQPLPATTPQQVNAATTALVTGGMLSIPTGGRLRIGSWFRWQITVSKTAAGTAASTWGIKVGTAGTTADTTRLSWATPVGTAAVDEGDFEIICTCRGPLSSVVVFYGSIWGTHRLATTGLINVQTWYPAPAASAGFDVTVDALKISLFLTTGASQVWTIQQCIAESFNLSP